MISQPQAGILGTYAVVKRPWVVQDELGEDVIAIRPIMNLTLTYDHRLVDGALAGRFLRDLREKLETWDETATEPRRSWRRSDEGAAALGLVARPARAGRLGGATRESWIGMVADGFILLGGGRSKATARYCTSSTRESAEAIHARLAEDNWTQNGMLETGSVERAGRILLDGRRV